MKITKFYEEAWFKAEYAVNENTVDFKAWEITGMDSDNIEESDIHEEEPCVTGFIKWDGCCEFNYSTHICGIHGAEHFLELMKEIYRFKGSLGGNFLRENID